MTDEDQAEAVVIGLSGFVIGDRVQVKCDGNRVDEDDAW